MTVTSLKSTGILILGFLLSVNTPSKLSAQSAIILDVGKITSGGTNASGVLFLVAHGANSAALGYDTPSFASPSTSIISGDDRLLTSVIFNGGVAQGTPDATFELNYTTLGVAAGTKFTGLFIAGPVSSYINTSTGALLSGYTFGTGTGSVPFTFGSYRTDVAEQFGGSDSSGIAWVLPSPGNYSLSAYTSSYAGGVTLDVPATLATSGSFSIVPEPSTGTLMMIGAVGLVALRRLRKV